MHFVSLNFLLFAGVLLVLYYCIPQKLQWWLLLAGSYVFYLAAGVEYLVFILFTTLTTYGATRLMGARLDKLNACLLENKATFSREEKKAAKEQAKKDTRRWMLLCVTTDFAILAVCKALRIDPFSAMAKGGSLSFLSLGLPLGISFYMFQSMGYVIDVHRGTAKAEKNFFKLALFVSYFPQLIQGPISKFNDLSKTLWAGHKFDGKTVTFGLQRMLWGYFKKMVVADRIAVAVVALLKPEHTGMSFLVLTVFYALQIYGDFTGGIDMAIGLSQALGITLPENFVRPFFSKNIAEYWRRWHISLGEWMKDYIFYPLSVSAPLRQLSKSARAKLGDVGKRIPVYIASIATWVVTGIWHGLTPNFVIWGLLNCFFIVLSQELQPLYAKFHSRFGWKDKGWYGVFEMLRMFMLMNLIRIVDLFPRVGEYFSRMASLITNPRPWVLWDGTLMKLGLTGLDYGILLGSVALMFAVSLSQEKKGSVREKLQALPCAVRYGLVFLLLVLVLLLGSYGIGYESGNFIYNQF